MEHKMGCACEKCRKREWNRLHPETVSDSPGLAGYMAKVDELAMLVRWMASVIKVDNPESVLAAQALDYLSRHNLKSSPLRQ